jgi:hypothetical protein
MSFPPSPSSQGTPSTNSPLGQSQQLASDSRLSTTSDNGFVAGESIMNPTLTVPSAGGAVRRKPARRANTAERRATHNAVERQRRETLNGRFLVSLTISSMCVHQFMTVYFSLPAMCRPYLPFSILFIRCCYILLTTSMSPSLNRTWRYSFPTLLPYADPPRALSSTRRSLSFGRNVASVQLPLTSCASSQLRRMPSVMK